MPALRPIAHSTFDLLFSRVSIAVLAQVVRVRYLQYLEQKEGILVWDLDVPIVCNFPLHRWNVILIPVHQTFSDLLLLVDLRQGDLTA